MGSGDCSGHRDLDRCYGHWLAMRKKKTKRVRLQPKSERIAVGQCILTDDIMSKVEELLLIGVPESACFEYLGIARRTYFNWKRWGSDYLDADAGDKVEEHRRYAKFVLRVRRAKAHWQINVVKRSFQGSYKASWIRDMSLLERRCRDEWGKKSEEADTQSTFDPDESFL